MGTSNTNQFELIRKIQYSNGTVTNWGPSYFVDNQLTAIRQIWSDLDTLANMHLDSAEPFKMTFEVGDNPTASFTFHETAETTATITWRIEKITKSND